MMKYWPVFHILLDCVGTNEIWQSSVTWTTNVPSHNWSCVPLPLLDIPSFRLGYPWYKLFLPPLIPCWDSMMYSLSHPWDSGTLQLDLGYVHHWVPWWTTSLKWVYCCIYSGSCKLPSLMKIPCLPPNHSSWYPFSPLIVVMMVGRRCWTLPSQSLSSIILQLKYR